MIFDSQAFNEVREKYKNVADYEVPKIVWLDRYAGLVNEKALLEELAGATPERKRISWISQLVKLDDEQFISVWFEMLLYDWLRNNFNVKVEPKIEGNDPDFSVDFDGTEVVIEAKAILKSADERSYERLLNKFLSLIANIPLPYLIIINKLIINERLNFTDTMHHIESWLRSFPETPFEYKDANGNQILLSSQNRPKSLKVTTVGPSSSLWVNPELLKPGLSKKANQHKELRNAGHPYVIAIYLEPHYLTAEEVVAAWFGQTTVVVDTRKDRVIEETTDMKGIHYFKGDIYHTSVSGTLVFSNYLKRYFGQVCDTKA